MTAERLFHVSDRGDIAVFEPRTGRVDHPQPVAPRIDDVLAELTRRDVELRVTPSLWPLRDAALASSLQFSFIRMAHARPR